MKCKFSRIAAAAALVLCFSRGLMAEQETPPPVYGNTVIFTLPQKSARLDSLIAKTQRELISVCNALGRLLPVEQNRLDYAVRLLSEADKSSDYREAALAVKASVYIVVTVIWNGREFIGEMKCVALNPAYARFTGDITVHGTVSANIPLKLAEKLARMHQGELIHAPVVSASGGELTVDAGQWNGLSEGTVRCKRGTLSLISVGRYRSEARADFNAEPGDTLSIEKTADAGKLLESLSRRIEKNIVRHYGIGKRLMRGDDPEKRLLTSMCIINPGSNICLPIYGSFLATDYLGFEKTSLHVPGFLGSSFFLINQFFLTEFMTGFKTNFFPWIRDHDKSAAVSRLHAFLWCTIPLTVTVSYFDQLSYQLEKYRYLPPFFEYRDWTAAALSLIFPGAGLMFKGNRAAGWAYFCSEMSLAAYGTYHLHDIRGKQALAVLGAVKVIELLHAYFAGVGYSFYRKESGDISMSFGIVPAESDEVVRLGAVYTM